MKTDPNILKQFYTVLNRSQLTEEIYDKLLEIWQFENIDLNEEMIKINQRKSNLSRSKRDSVPEFLILRRILDEKKTIESQVNTMNNTDEQNFGDDQITL